MRAARTRRTRRGPLRGACAGPALGLFALLSLAAAPAPGADAPPDPFAHFEVRVKGRVYPYAVWSPPGAELGALRPAVMFLHGSGESGSDGVKPTRVGLGPELLRHPERWPCVVIFPQKPTDTEEWWEHEDGVIATLADAERRLRIDPSRVALTGMSQGGHGVWLLGARHPELWTCLAPVCGYGRARTIASRIDGLPVWAFHGLADDLVLPGDTRTIVRELRSRRGEPVEEAVSTGTVRLSLYEGVNHGVWDTAYAEPELPAWLLAAPAKRRTR